MRVTRLLVLAAAATAAAAAAGAAFPSRPEGTLVARVCTGQSFNDEWCEVDERRRLLRAERFVCSARVDVPRRTRLTISIVYEGRVQRTSSRVVGDGWTFLDVWFPNLDSHAFRDAPDYGLPGGRYRCDFVLGGSRTSIRFRSAGPTGSVLAPYACRVLGRGDPIFPYCDGYRIPPARAVACGATFARLVGQPVEIEVLRGQERLYAARQVVRTPIETQWAYAAAPGGAFLPVGEYACRFRVAGRVVEEFPFRVVE